MILWRSSDLLLVEIETTAVPLLVLLWRFARLPGVIDGCYYADWHNPAQLSFCVAEQVKEGVTSYEMVDSLAMQQAHVCRQCINTSYKMPVPLYSDSFGLEHDVEPWAKRSVIIIR